MIRNKISSDINDLDNLNKIYSWIPNKDTIRPTESEIIKKKEILNIIEKEWLSLKDYILHTIFDQNYEIKNNYKFIKLNTSLEWIFCPSNFRYNIIDKANHYILWNSNQNFYYDFDDDLINKIIITNLQKKLNHNNFNFAWYKNPKPTILEFYHIQVFWIEY